MASDLENFDLPQMLRCGLGVRRATNGAASMEDALAAVCRFLYEELHDAGGRRACVLVRAYKTHPFDALDAGLQRFASGLMGDTTPAPSMKCLTLMATSGEMPEWNDRRQSAGHQAIPLPRPDIVEKAPMIAQLIRQFGLDLGQIVKPSPDFMQDMEGRTYGVFFVPDAKGSPYIPAQDQFVLPHGVRSVIGCGGSLRGGDLFAVILFTRLQLTQDVADRFRTIALDIKSSLFFFDEESVFSAPARRRRS
jgi:hypothetical protein